MRKPNSILERYLPRYGMRYRRGYFRLLIDADIEFSIQESEFNMISPVPAKSNFQGIGFMAFEF
jgi:hypothetical protein